MIKYCSRIFITAVCVINFGIAAVGAAPSVNGPTGLINIPSADVLHEGQYSLGYYNLKEGGAGSFNFNLVRNLEVGVAGLRYDNSSNHTLLNAKYAVLPETILSPGLSIGVEDLTGDQERSAYAAVSKALPFGFRIHAGVGNGRFSGGFYGIEKTINPISIVTGNSGFPATTLILERDGRHTNYGARLAVAAGLKMDAGWRDRNFYVGLSLTR